jgi:hypothetical protein
VPLPAQYLASVFVSHTRPKAALSKSFNPALAVVFHIAFLCSSLFHGDYANPGDICNTLFYTAGKIFAVMTLLLA